MWSDGGKSPFAKGGENPVFPVRSGQNRTKALLDGETCRERSLGKGEVDAGRDQEAKNPDFPVISGQNRTFVGSVDLQEAESVEGLVW